MLRPHFSGLARSKSGCNTARYDADLGLRALASSSQQCSCSNLPCRDSWQLSLSHETQGCRRKRNEFVPRCPRTCASFKNSNFMSICYFKQEFFPKDSTLTKKISFLCVWLRHISRMAICARAELAVFARKPISALSTEGRHFFPIASRMSSSHFQ